MITEDHRAWRLAPGAHAVPTDDGGLLLSTPADEIARVDLTAADRDVLLELLAGGLPPAEALRRADDPDTLAEVLVACTAEGIAGPGEATAEPPADKVVVAGDNPLSAAVISVLSAAGFAVAGVTAPGDDTELLVDCAGWLPDRRWQRLDAARTEAGAPWHRCHVEGTRLVIGPFSVPPGPSYADTRTRRLAASAWPDELEALWRHLDEAPAGPVPWPDAGVLAIAAGLITADLCAHRAGRRPAGADHQVVIDPAGPTWRTHPVLAVPTGLMREPVLAVPTGLMREPAR